MIKMIKKKTDFILLIKLSIIYVLDLQKIDIFLELQTQL